MSLEWIKEQFAAIKLRINLLFTRGIVSVVYKVGANKMQTLQASGLDGDLAESVEHFEPYGLACNPLPGSEAFLLSLLGQRSHLLAFVTDPRECPTGRKPGEVILWSKYGQRIWLHDDGSITLSAPSPITVSAPKVTVDAPDVNIKSNKAVIDCTDINIGGEGGAQVARVGDMVAVGSGSSAGNWPIVSGSEKVRVV